MGPYCQFCNQRCFVPFPLGTPEHILRAYKAYGYGGNTTIIATCAGGQAFEKQKVGFCYDDIMETIEEES